MGSVSQEQEPGRFCAGAQGNSSHGGLPQRHSRHCLCRQSSPSLQAPTQQPGAGASAGRPREWDGKEAQHGCVRPWSCLTATRERNANQAQSHTAWAHNCLPTFLLITGRALLPGALELPALPEQPSTSPRTANWSPGQDDAIEQTHPPLPLTTVPSEKLRQLLHPSVLGLTADLPGSATFSVLFQFLPCRRSAGWLSRNTLCTAWPSMAWTCPRCSRASANMSEVSRVLLGCPPHQQPPSDGCPAGFVPLPAHSPQHVLLKG